MSFEPKKMAVLRILQILEKYRKHFYECCDEFHACEHVCPAKLPLTDLMSYMNMEMKKAGETGGKKDV